MCRGPEKAKVAPRSRRRGREKPPPGPAPCAPAEGCRPALSRFAMEKSQWQGRLSRFAVEKSQRRGRLSRFAMRKGGAGQIPAHRFQETAAPSRVNFREIADRGYPAQKQKKRQKNLAS